jgi:squalene-hopene/tetraprenyl-beta-curcumene cyclase
MAVPPTTIPSGAADDAALSRAWAAIHRTTSLLADTQEADGHWCAELEGDTILESETILLYAFLEREQDPRVVEAANYILSKQRADGGWSQFADGPVDVSISVKAYFALKVAGQDKQSPAMVGAREAILAAGGADRVNSFTRFYLALLGQISYDQCPAVPPEMVLLPDWFPVNIYRFSAWSRTIFVPLSLVWAHRPSRTLPEAMSISELFHNAPNRWPALKNPGGSGRLGERLLSLGFRGMDFCLKLAEKMRIRPWRRKAVRSAERWMCERFEASDGLGAIYPPIVWSLIALRCLGYDDSSPEVSECHKQLDQLQIREQATGGQVTCRWQPCKSPVWDTAIALRSLAAHEFASTDTLVKATEWLLDNEISQKGDWARRNKVAPSGWCFEYRNSFYPDIDDTIMVMMAMQEASQRDDVKQRLPAGAVAAATERGRRWVLAMQNKDGGWGAFDRDNDADWLCHVPFADHNAMIDPSNPDITARVLEALAGTGMEADDPTICKAIRYIRSTQETDGSWFGRWGVNYIYGTWQVLVGLREIGVPVTDPAIQRGADWLERHQQSDGGWGESANSYLDDAWRGRGIVTASQTAWALLGLIAAGRHESAAVMRGLEALSRTQHSDGRWEEKEFTGTGFPRVFYLRYHNYAIYFPLLAFAQWRSAVLAGRVNQWNADAA